MKTLKEKQLVFLEDTVKHYNANNRGMVPGQEYMCQYSAIDGISDGCAIGRHCSKELCARLDSEEFQDKSGVNNIELFDLLPENLKELGIHFLAKIQGFHDSPNNWTNNGLSAEGFDESEYIRNWINSN
jgi:hypothetical protein